MLSGFLNHKRGIINFARKNKEINKLSLEPSEWTYNEELCHKLRAFDGFLMNLCEFPPPAAILLIQFLQSFNKKIENYTFPIKGFGNSIRFFLRGGGGGG